MNHDRAWSSKALIAAAALATSLLSAVSAAASEAVAIADGVHVLLGDNGEIGPHNKGDIGNAAFVVGRDQVIVIDTGVSYRYGAGLLAEIAKRTSRPVRLAIITHPIQEFLFGAAAFEERGIPLLTHVKSAELIRSRCETCLKNLTRTLGEDVMRGSRVVVPERKIDGSTTIDLGGRVLDVIHPGWASTPGDLAVFDRASGTLFAGGLVDVERVPEVRDGDVDAWISSLEELKKLPIRQVVPGHGPVSAPARIDDMIAYLRALDAKVRSAYASGVSLSEAASATALPRFAAWKQYAVTHPQNVQHLYLKFEAEEFGR